MKVNFRITKEIVVIFCFTWRPELGDFKNPLTSKICDASCTVEPQLYVPLGFTTTQVL